jgi:hypothetical protein
MIKAVVFNFANLFYCWTIVILYNIYQDNIKTIRCLKKVMMKRKWLGYSMGGG